MTFDDPVDRNAVPTLKWGRWHLAQHVGNEDALPVSVADMDLPWPPAVVERLAARVDHRRYG